MNSLITTLAEQALSWGDTDSVNRAFKEIHDHYDSGAFTEFQYEQIFNRIAARYPVEIKEHFLNRSDKKNPRPLGEFAVDIYNGQKNQEAIIEWFIRTQAQGHFPNVGPLTAKCVGVAPAGYLILKNGQDTGMPDYLLSPIEKLLETKGNPCWYKATYKMDDIKSYREKKSYVLTVCTRGKRIYADGKNIVCSFMFTPEILDRMVEKSVVTSRWEVGHKEAIQFWFNMTKAERKSKIMGDKLSKHALPLEDFVEIVWHDESKKLVLMPGEE